MRLIRDLLISPCSCYILTVRDMHEGLCQDVYRMCTAMYPMQSGHITMHIMVDTTC